MALPSSALSEGLWQGRPMTENRPYVAYPLGYCEEHPLHLFHKRILAARLDAGDAALHLDAVARAIGLS